MPVSCRGHGLDLGTSKEAMGLERICKENSICVVKINRKSDQDTSLIAYV